MSPPEHTVSSDSDIFDTEETTHSDSDLDSFAFMLDDCVDVIKESECTMSDIDTVADDTSSMSMEEDASVVPVLESTTLESLLLNEIPSSLIDIQLQYTKTLSNHDVCLFLGINGYFDDWVGE